MRNYSVLESEFNFKNNGGGPSLIGATLGRRKNKVAAAKSNS